MHDACILSQLVCALPDGILDLFCSTYTTFMFVIFAPLSLKSTSWVVLWPHANLDAQSGHSLYIQTEILSTKSPNHCFFSPCFLLRLLGVAGIMFTLTVRSNFCWEVLLSFCQISNCMNLFITLLIHSLFLRSSETKGQLFKVKLKSRLKTVSGVPKVFTSDLF